MALSDISSAVITNKFRQQIHFHANQSHFHEKGFVLRLVKKQRHKRTQKWPFGVVHLMLKSPNN